MTSLRLLAAFACAAAALALERFLCTHAARQARRIAVHPADGRSAIVLNCCPGCGARWLSLEGTCVESSTAC